MIYICVIAASILCAMYLIRKIHIEMNLFQIHSYDSKEMLNQIFDKEKHDKRELILDFLPAIGFITCGLMNLTIMTLVTMLMECVIFYNLFSYTFNPNIKKPLVKTERVKRMFIVLYSLVAILCLVPALLIFFIPAKLLRVSVLISVLLFTLYGKLTRFLVVFSNTLMKPIESKMNKEYIEDAKNILASMPSLKIIGVTGSYGKTSTKFAIATLLSEKYSVCKTPGSYNTTMGVVRTIRENLDKDDEIFVCEMGSRHLGDINEICEIVKPQVGVITAIGDAHLETFGNIENTKEAKFELARSLPSNAPLYVNIDNENIIAKLGNDVDKNLNKYKVVTYSLKDKDADYYATNIEYTARGSKFDVIIDGNEKNKFNVEIKLLGKHNIYNTLCAIAVARDNKLTNEEIIKGCSKLKGVEHRLEILKSTNQITVIDDTFNANPEGAREALEVLKRMEGNKKIIITPGMTEQGEKEYELNKEFGFECSKSANYTIMVGVRQTKPMQDAFKENKIATNKYYVARNLDDASMHLQKILELGDVVLYENDMPEDM